MSRERITKAQHEQHELLMLWVRKTLAAADQAERFAAAGQADRLQLLALADYLGAEAIAQLEVALAVVGEAA